MTMELTTIKPGIYPGMSFDDYAKIDAINCGKLAWLKGSPAHMKAVLDGRLERDDTPSLGFGRALHIRLLEPDTYANRVKIKQPCQKELASGPRKGKPCGSTSRGMFGGGWYCGQHGGDESSLEPGFEYLTIDESARIERAAAALKDRKLDALRKVRGLFEVVMVAEIAGTLVKCRLDKYIEKPCTVVDVKTVQAPGNPGSIIAAGDFEKRIASYGYGFTAALYCDVVKALTGTDPRWYWLTIENDEPFTPAVYRASDECLQAGRNEYMAYLHQFKTCSESNLWPGPGDEPVTIDGPAWWLKQHGVKL